MFFPDISFFLPRSNSMISNIHHHQGMKCILLLNIPAFFSFSFSNTALPGEAKLDDETLHLEDTKTGKVNPKHTKISPKRNVIFSRN